MSNELSANTLPNALTGGDDVNIVIPRPVLFGGEKVNLDGATAVASIWIEGATTTLIENRAATIIDHNGDKAIQIALTASDTAMLAPDDVNELPNICLGEVKITLSDNTVRYSGEFILNVRSGRTPDGPVVPTPINPAPANFYALIKNILRGGDNVTLAPDDGARTLTINAMTGSSVDQTARDDAAAAQRTANTNANAIAALERRPAGGGSGGNPAAIAITPARINVLADLDGDYTLHLRPTDYIPDNANFLEIWVGTEAVHSVNWTERDGPFDIPFNISTSEETNIAATGQGILVRAVFYHRQSGANRYLAETGTLLRVGHVPSELPALGAGQVWKGQSDGTIAAAADETGGGGGTGGYNGSLTYTTVSTATQFTNAINAQATNTEALILTCTAEIALVGVTYAEGQVLYVPPNSQSIEVMFILPNAQVSRNTNAIAANSDDITANSGQIDSAIRTANNAVTAAAGAVRDAAAAGRTAAGKQDALTATQLLGFLQFDIVPSVITGYNTTGQATDWLTDWRVWVSGGDTVGDVWMEMQAEGQPLLAAPPPTTPGASLNRHKLSATNIYNFTLSNRQRDNLISSRTTRRQGRDIEIDLRFHDAASGGNVIDVITIAVDWLPAKQDLLPALSDGQIWQGSGGAVVAAAAPSGGGITYTDVTPFTGSNSRTRQVTIRGTSRFKDIEIPAATVSAATGFRALLAWEQNPSSGSSSESYYIIEFRLDEIPASPGSRIFDFGLTLVGSSNRTFLNIFWNPRNAGNLVILGQQPAGLYISRLRSF